MKCNDKKTMQVYCPSCPTLHTEMEHKHQGRHQVKTTQAKCKEDGLFPVDSDQTVLLNKANILKADEQWQLKTH